MLLVTFLMEKNIFYDLQRVTKRRKKAEITTKKAVCFSEITLLEKRV